MAANTNIADDLRRRLETLSTPGKSADDLANEAIALYLRNKEQDKDWADLVAFGINNGASSGYSEHDVAKVVRQVRKSR